MRVFTPAGAPVPASEQQVVNVLGPAPGMLLVNILAKSSKRVREVDVVVISGTVLASIEVKATMMVGDLQTSLNDAWTVGGKTVDFAGSPNPLAQARAAAAATRGHVERETGANVFIPAIVVVAGNATVAPHTIGDVWVCSPDQLGAVLLRLKPQPVDAETAVAIAAAFGFTVNAAVLVADEAFHTGHGQAVKRQSSAQVRRQERYDAMEDVALVMWTASHKRNLITSAIIAFCSFAYFLWDPRFYALIGGLFAASVVGAWQLYQRSRIAGPRMAGKLSAAWWVLSLSPYFAVGFALSVPFESSSFGVDERVIAWYVSILVTLAILAMTLVGRSGFIYPPQEVVEKQDKHGNPTGLFMLTSPGQRRKRYNLRLIDPNDPRVRSFTDTSGG